MITAVRSRINELFEAWELRLDHSERDILIAMKMTNITAIGLEPAHRCTLTACFKARWDPINQGQATSAPCWNGTKRRQLRRFRWSSKEASASCRSPSLAEATALS